MMYKLHKNTIGKIISVTVLTPTSFSDIPLDADNTDYQQFKKDIMDGGELQDADGAVMTAKKAKEFIKELP